MPIKGKTRMDPPMPKKGTARGLFVQRTSVGEKPHAGGLNSALKVSPQAKVGGKTTLSR